MKKAWKAILWSQVDVMGNILHGLIVKNYYMKKSYFNLE